MPEYHGVLLRVAGKDEPERLQVGRRGGEPGKIDELLQGLKLYDDVLMEASVASVLPYQILDHRSSSNLSPGTASGKTRPFCQAHKVAEGRLPGS